MAIYELCILPRQDAIGGRQEQRESRVHQVDLRQADRDVPAQDDPLVQQVVDDVEKRGILGSENLFGPCRFRRTYRSASTPAGTHFACRAEAGPREGGAWLGEAPLREGGSMKL